MSLGSACLGGMGSFHRWLKTGAPVGFIPYFPSFYEAVDKMRYFGGAGANAFFFTYSNNTPVEAMTTYVQRKLAWNLGAEVEPLIDRFMEFHYGQGAPAMRHFFDLVEDKRAAFGRRGNSGGHLGVDYIPLVVDAETVDKGLACLTEAEPLVQRESGKRMLKDWKRQLLDSYLLRNKSFTHRDADLERFAKALAETLRTAREFKDAFWNKPKWGVGYREMVWVASGIDLGEKEPWFKSPVVDEILKDPLGMVKSKLRGAYEKTAKGLSFNMKSVAGGKDSNNYQWQGVPKTKRGYAKVLRRASSPVSTLSTSFDLADIPVKGGVLRLEGLDDEKSGRAALKVLLNGKVVFDAENRFGEDDWSWTEIPVPAAILKQGVNSLEIANATPEKVAAVADIYERDYTWGWIMVSAAELVFPEGPNPVIGGEPLVFDGWKKARMDFSAGGRKLKALGDWGSGSPTHVWGESKTPLTDKWEEWSAAVVTEEDCMLTMQLGGAYLPAEKESRKPLPIWAAYDEVRLDGAELKNGGFETLDSKGLPEGWVCARENVITDGDAAEGKIYIKASFDKPVKQTLAVKAGKPVTVAVKVRRAEL